MTPLRTVLTAAVIAFGALTGQALAHATMTASEPAADAVLAAPERVTLSFSETIGLPFSSIALTGPDGAEIETGDLALSDDRHSLIVPILAPLQPGEHIVNWGVLSQDGHRIDGEFGFTVE